MQFLSTYKSLLNCTFLHHKLLPSLCQRFFYIDNRDRKPRLGKFHGYSIKYQNKDHFKLSLKRGFTRSLVKEFGVETGLKDMVTLTLKLKK